MTNANNPYWHQYFTASEQDLLQDLYDEACEIYGIEMLYLPRETRRLDELYNEDTVSIYRQAIPIDVVVKTIERYGGQGIFMSKFGIQIRDQATFTISRRHFDEKIQPVAGITRPRATDLLYFPFSKRLYRILSVNFFEYLFPLGTIPSWELTVEVFEYANEKFETGVPEIDELMTNSTDVLQHMLRDEFDNILTTGNNDIVVSSLSTMSLRFIPDNEFIQEGSPNFPMGSEVLVVPQFHPFLSRMF